MPAADAPGALLPGGRLWYRRSGSGLLSERVPADAGSPDGDSPISDSPDGDSPGGDSPVGAGILVRGADRGSFLTRIMSGALPRAPGAARTALLGPKGNLVAAAVATVLREQVVLDCEPARQEALRAGLDRYRIADRVEILGKPPEPAANLTVFGTATLGSVAAAVAAAIATNFPPASAPSGEALAALAPGGVLETAPGEGRFVRRDFAPWPSFTVHGPPTETEAAVSTLQNAASEVSSAEAEYLRLAAGEPRRGAELDDSSLPLASGLAAHVRLGQGCYIGQEYVARQAHRGRVPRLLRQLRFPAGAPPPGAAVTLEDRAVGTITSTAPRPPDWPPGPALALATLPAEIAPGAAVACAGAEATVHSLP